MKEWRKLALEIKELFKAHLQRRLENPYIDAARIRGCKIITRSSFACYAIDWSTRSKKKKLGIDLDKVHPDLAARLWRAQGMWVKTVSHVRAEQHRKTAFMSGFESLVAGAGPSDEPCFLERAKARWSGRQRRER